VRHVAAGLGHVLAAKGTLVLGTVLVPKVSLNAILLFLFWLLDGNENTAVYASTVLLSVGCQSASLAAQPGQPGVFLQQHKLGLKACCVGGPPALRGAE